MGKNKLLFNKEYEDFYRMAEDNKIFSNYCTEVHGIDFSQDGYSDKKQIDEMLIIAGIQPGYKVLDIGCGNGKMGKYIAEKTGAIVYGFDYSENGIRCATKQAANNKNLNFEEGVIGEKEYPSDNFDVILSIDTLYYTLDMEGFVKQIHSWMKLGGVFLAFYSEGQLMTRSPNEKSTELAVALDKCEASYMAIDYTRSHYELLKHKREVIETLKEKFLTNNMEFFYQSIIATSIENTMSFEAFQEQYSRYLYVIRKEVKHAVISEEIVDEQEDPVINLKIAQSEEESPSEEIPPVIPENMMGRNNPFQGNRMNMNRMNMNRNNMFRINPNQRRQFNFRNFK